MFFCLTAAAFRLNERGIRLGTLAYIIQRAAFRGWVIPVGMNGCARSIIWQQVGPPTGTSAISCDTTGQTLHAGAQDGQPAHTFRSTDSGPTWTPTEGTPQMPSPAATATKGLPRRNRWRALAPVPLDASGQR